MALNSLRSQSGVFATCRLSLCAMKNVVSLVQADAFHMLPPIEEEGGKVGRELVLVSECSFGVVLMGRGCIWLFSWAIRRGIE